MNLRLKENSLRVRVTQRDLDAFRRHGRAEQKTHFGKGTVLTGVLLADAKAQTPTAHFDGACITVRIPEALAEEWTTTDRIGFEAEQPTGDGRALHIAVEKDLGCQHKGDPEREEKFTELAEKQRDA